MMNIDKIKEDIIEDFNSKDNVYECDDRLNVSMHEIIDKEVSFMPIDDIFDNLKKYDGTDIENIDKGMYENVLEERGFIALCRVLLYCVIENEIWEDEKIRELQDIKKVNGIKLR